MKKIIEILIALIILFSSYQQRPAGGVSSANGRLIVTASRWRNEIIFGMDGPPHEYDLILNTKYVLPDLGINEITFEITNINNDGIAIKTSEGLAISHPETGIDAYNPLSSFEIKYGEPLMLATMSPDGGGYYYFELCQD